MRALRLIQIFSAVLFMMSGSIFTMEEARSMDSIDGLGRLVDLIINEGDAVADAIYQADVEGFLKIDAILMAQGQCHEDVRFWDRNTKDFLDLGNELSMMVKSTLKFAEDEEISIAWLEIAHTLLEQFDYFGYTNIYIGLVLAGVFDEYDIDELMFPELSHYSTYVRTKLRNPDVGIIPALFQECMAFNRYMCLVRESNDDLDTPAKLLAAEPESCAAFVLDIQFMQEALRYRVRERIQLGVYTLSEILDMAHDDACGIKKLLAGG